MKHEISDVRVIMKQRSKMSVTERGRYPAIARLLTDRVQVARRLQSAAGIAIAVAALYGCSDSSVRAAGLPGERPGEHFEVRVEVEEDAFSHGELGHGIYALWNYGSTTLVRQGDTVVASGIGRLDDRRPLNNVICRLGVRNDDGAWVWRDVAESAPTREPCPVGIDRASSEILLTTSRVLDLARDEYVASEPAVTWFRLDDGKLTYRRGWAPWAERDNPREFWDHTRRSFAVDSEGRRFFLMANAGETHDRAEWVVRDLDTLVVARGRVDWPVGVLPAGMTATLAYAQSALHGDAAHLFAVLDVPEPVADWNRFKTGGKPGAPDYVFRRLFYAWTPSFAGTPFQSWVEVANVESTAGEVKPGDMRVDADGTVHLVWTEFRTWPPELRLAFFPDLRQRFRLQYARVRDGRVVMSRTLHESAEDDVRSDGAPVTSRFHRLADGTLVVVFALLPRPPHWRQHNRLMVLGSDGEPGRIFDLPLAMPLLTFATASERAGSAPSDTIDLLGSRSWYTPRLRYVRLAVKRE